MHLWFVHWNFRFFIFRGRRRVEDELRVDRLHFVVVTRPDPDPNAAIVVVVVVLAVVVVVVVDTRRRRRRRRPIRVLSRCDDDVGVSSRSSLLNVDDRRRLVLGAAAASGNAHDDDTTEREQKKTNLSGSPFLSLSLSLDDAARARSKKEVPRKEKGKKNGEETFVLKWKNKQSKNKKKGGAL